MDNFKFYSAYIKLIDIDHKQRKEVLRLEELGTSTPESIFSKKLRSTAFRNFIINKFGKNYETVQLIKNSMISAMIRPQRLLTDTDKFYLACDMITNTYYICYKELMMIDIDFYKDHEGSKDERSKDNEAVNKSEGNKTEESKDHDLLVTKQIESIVSMFSKDVETNPDHCWVLYRTKGGIHAFLVSKSMNFESDEAINMMLKLRCDFNYIIYSHLRGWCVRLNRKQKETHVVSDLITQIGNPAKIVRELYKLVDLHIRMIKVFQSEPPCSMYGQ
jgi:hypothetical protein